MNNNILSIEENNMLSIEEYDSHGKLIYNKSIDGWEAWYTYDSHGNLIYIKYGSGYKKCYTPNGALIYRGFSRPWKITISMALLSIRNMLTNMIHGLKRMLNDKLYGIHP